jgi:hypothetical protein
MSIMTLITASIHTGEMKCENARRNSLRRLSGLSPAEILFYEVESQQILE